MDVAIDRGDLAEGVEIVGILRKYLVEAVKGLLRGGQILGRGEIGNYLVAVSGSQIQLTCRIGRVECYGLLEVIDCFLILARLESLNALDELVARLEFGTSHCACQCK